MSIGEPAPWFHAQALSGNPNYAFSSAAGRWILMLFVGRAGDPAAQVALQVIAEHRHLFDDERACFFGVTTDPSDEPEGRIAQQLPGIRWFLDYDRKISTAYGACAGDPAGQDYTPYWVALDPMLRVCLHGPLSAGSEVLKQFEQFAATRWVLPAPVLMVPNVLSTELCQRLIDLYEQNGGEQSGFMREIDGVTRLIVDDNHKRRADCPITDNQIVATLQDRVMRALCPAIERVFQFKPTRIERYIVACYEADGGGYFRPHRDNTTKGTAHRKFAVTINLDTSRYEGGDLCFPEFGPQTYRAPTGGAVVFSCSLLHEAKPVTQGKRYAFLPFLYDDESARLRERNLGYLSHELQDYRSGLPAEDETRH